MTKNLVNNSCTKHIVIKRHFIRGVVVDDEIQLKYCRTKDKIAYIFIKALLRNKFQYLRVLGSKTLGLNVLELQFVMLANHDQNVLVFVLDLLKVCLYVKLESSVLQDLLCNSAWLDRSKIRLDRSKLVQIVFL